MSLLTEIKELPARTKALGLFLLLAIVSLVFSWYNPTPKGSPNFTTAKPISGTSSIPKKEVVVAKGTVKVLPKNLVNKKTPIPPEILNDESKEISATADVPPSEAGSEVISVIDVNTRETVLMTREKQLSLFAFENKGRVGVAYGISNYGTTGKVYADWTFLRIAKAHLGAQVEINSTTTREPEAKALIKIDGYSW